MGTTEVSEILFEHALLDHLRAGDFAVTPSLHRDREGAGVMVGEDVLSRLPRG
jgi:Ser/Thr protein kinase RdoA (MazF antagonist)